MTPELLKYVVKISAAIVAVCVVAWVGLQRIAPASKMSSGVLSGTTNYPSEYIPEQVICAEPLDGGKDICTIAPAGDAEQLIPSWTLLVPAGSYYVYARVKDPEELGSDLGMYRAYYSTFVTWGLSYECKDHTRISVSVTSGGEVSGIMPYDWYNR